MDEELRTYLETMEGRLTANVGAWGGRLEAEQIKLRGELNAMRGELNATRGELNATRSELNAIDGRLMARLNNSEERILNRLAAMEGDALNTKGFLLNDAVIAGRRWFDLEARVTKLEDRKS
jgi:hypothetical protein